MKLHTLTCERCHRTFTNKHVRQRFCSHACGNAEYVDKTRICEQCGCSYQRRPTNPKQRFCSMRCLGIYCGKKRAVKVEQQACATCGRLFDMLYKDKRFCSQECYGASIRTLSDINCRICGSVFRPIEASQTICGAQCRKVILAENTRKALARSGPNNLELRVYESLVDLDVFFCAEHALGVYTIDFFLPMMNTALEVDGVYWHSRQGSVEHDDRRDQYMRSLGMEVVRITDREIDAADDLTELLAAYLKIT